MMDSLISRNSPLSGPRTYYTDDFLPETYNFAAVEFEAFAMTMENDGYPLNKYQQRYLSRIAQYYRQKSTVQ